MITAAFEPADDFTLDRNHLALTNDTHPKINEFQLMRIDRRKRNTQNKPIEYKFYENARPRMRDQNIDEVTERERESE